MDMEWTEEAEAAIKKVPFFVRKRVRTSVEEDARRAGKGGITLSDVRLTKKRYLSNMSDDIKGYQIDECFGPGGCPNRAVENDQLVEKLETGLKKAELRQFLEENVKGGLKHHHEFRVTVADCPNACSQPQIKDMGIIGAVEPLITDEPCTLCHACEEACKENAVMLRDTDEVPVIDMEACVKCGKCISTCPTSTLTEGKKGYRILLGGKLGRHPRLAMEMEGIYSEDEAMDIMEKCLKYYKKHSKKGKRFAEIIKDVEFISEGVV